MVKAPRPKVKADPAATTQGLLIVGIGASAGGLAAYEAFFSTLPPDTDLRMAFVLVQHLAPDHVSLLPELVQRFTHLKVHLITSGMVVRPNCVYVIPAGHDVAIINGEFQLLAQSTTRGLRLPIDFFFTSLAQDQQENAVAIVLSGTGSDGTLGGRAIKAEGGIVLAQTPTSTEFGSMPQSAIQAGIVDQMLLPHEMGKQLIAYSKHCQGRPIYRHPESHSTSGDARAKIFVLLRKHTGHDFSLYKTSTINRRIQRRMALLQINDLPAYVLYLQRNPAELDLLIREFLIGVTRFFRDPEVFAVLKESVIPQLLANQPEDGVVRLWVAACSTSEEAYSIAILVRECQELLNLHGPVQIFASDIDGHAIDYARSGRYPAGIAANLTRERLKRFFTFEPGTGGYRVDKRIRELVVFSEQNIIKDPPFSRLDLISCRNFLIYLTAELQRKVMATFHFALKPAGTLLLGGSETAGDSPLLFETLDYGARLYRRRMTWKSGMKVPPALSLRPDVPAQPPAAAQDNRFKFNQRLATARIRLHQVNRSGFVVNGLGDILHWHGPVGKFLQPAKATPRAKNILTSVHRDLEPSLRSAFHEATQTEITVHRPSLRLKVARHLRRVDLAVLALQPEPGQVPESRLYLVTFEEQPTAALAPPARADQPTQLPAHPAPRVTQDTFIALQQTLRAKDEYLQSASEELQSSSEELKASNEEMQSMNEELQSANEELETSKEELQSLNEELATVNTELNSKLTDLTRANNDMNNLVAGTGIATVFLDYQLRIMRFTPAFNSFINLLPSDVGRPILHFTNSLIGYDRLGADVQGVLDTLAVKEVEVQAKTGEWYLMRIQPYRTVDHVIEGAVISFFGITEIVRARLALQQTSHLMRMAVVVKDSHDAITMQDLAGRTLAWNPSAVRIYGWSEAEALQLNVRDRIPPKLEPMEIAKIHELGEAPTILPYRTQRLSKSGAVVDIWMTATALLDQAGKMYAVATTERTVNENQVERSAP